MSAEELLRQLLNDLFYVNEDGHLVWGMKEDISIHWCDSELEKKLRPYIENDIAGFRNLKETT